MEDISTEPKILPYNQTCFPFSGQAEFYNLQSPQNPITLDTNHVIVLSGILLIISCYIWDEGQIKIKEVVFILGSIS